MGRADPSLRDFSKAVEAIYDCALNPHGWRDTLRLIGGLTHSTHVAIGTMDYDQKQLLNAIEYGYDQAAWNTYLEKYSVNPAMRRCHRIPVGAVYTTPMPEEIWHDLLQSEFYHAWAMPYRTGELVGVNGLRRGRRIVSARCPPYTPAARLREAGASAHGRSGAAPLPHVRNFGCTGSKIGHGARIGGDA
jgi:hypothetical protein